MAQIEQCHSRFLGSRQQWNRKQRATPIAYGVALHELLNYHSRCRLLVCYFYICKRLNTLLGERFHKPFSVIFEEVCFMIVYDNRITDTGAANLSRMRSAALL